jgi:hypothetical protein
MGIRDKAERLIGSIRRECTDHVVAIGEGHLRRILKFFTRDSTTALEKFVCD